MRVASRILAVALVATACAEAPSARPPASAASRAATARANTPEMLRQTTADAQVFRSALLLYLGQQPGGDCPTLDELRRDGALLSTQSSTDAWGQPFVFECDGDDVIVTSIGPDGTYGTMDDIGPEGSGG